MKSKKKVFIRKKVFSQLEVPLLINFSFVSQWNNPKESKIIKGKAWNVSRKGLCLEAAIYMKDGMLKFLETEATEKVKVLPYLILSEIYITLEFNLSPVRNRIIITGKPIWHELASGESISTLKIGVLFTDVSREARDKWVQYIQNSDSLLGL